MYPFQIVGTFLTGAPTDDAVLAFAAHTGQFGAANLHCVLVDDPDSPFSAGTADADQFEGRVRAALPKEMIERTTFEVRRGNPLDEGLRVARDRNLDLAIIGRKIPSSQIGEGVKVARVVRKAPCSVLVVPEYCRPHFGRVLVAIDCSAHSKLAIEAAVGLVKASSEARPELIALTVRRITARHDLAGVTFEESVEAQRTHGRRDLDAFLKDIDAGGVPIEPLVILSEQPALAISHVAMAKKMDIVVAGTRGITMTAAALLGSTSEELLMACAMPLLMVKKKGETLHLLEAIFSTG